MQEILKRERKPAELDIESMTPSTLREREREILLSLQAMRERESWEPGGQVLKETWPGSVVSHYCPPRLNMEFERGHQAIGQVVKRCSGALGVRVRFPISLLHASFTPPAMLMSSLNPSPSFFFRTWP